MAITVLANGATVIEGEESMKFFQMATLRSGLKLELVGMRMSRGPTCYAIIKARFGLKGSKAKVLAQFEKLLAEQNSKVIRVVETV